MRYFFPILRILAGIAVCIAVIMVSYEVKKRLNPQSETSTEVVTETEEKDSPISSFVVEGESNDRLAEKLRLAGDSKNYKPGEKAFSRIKDLLAGNFYFEAQEQLKELIEKYPYAPSVFEARRILGQYNVDQFLGSGSSNAKKLYKVKSGDTFYKIAKDNETSLRNLMLLNGLFSTDKLYADDDIGTR